jgi:hypothetical protein
VLVQDSESYDSIAQMALQDRREDGLDRMPTQNESLTFAQTVLAKSSKGPILCLHVYVLAQRSRHDTKLFNGGWPYRHDGGPILGVGLPLYYSRRHCKFTQSTLFVLL